MKERKIVITFECDDENFDVTAYQDYLQLMFEADGVNKNVKVEIDKEGV